MKGPFKVERAELPADVQLRPASVAFLVLDHDGELVARTGIDALYGNSLLSAPLLEVYGLTRFGQLAQQPTAVEIGPVFLNIYRSGGWSDRLELHGNTSQLSLQGNDLRGYRLIVALVKK